MYVLQLMDWYSASFSVLFIAVVECIVINHVYSKFRLPFVFQCADFITGAVTIYLESAKVELYSLLHSCNVNGPAIDTLLGNV